MENNINKNEEISHNNEEILHDEELENNKSNSNKFQKYFFGTLSILIVGYAIVALVAINNSKEENTNNIKEEKNREPIIKIIEVSSDKIRNNLTINGKYILDNLNQKIENMNNAIDRQLDDAFNEIINKNIDLYLDFHYSFIGSYVELGTMAFNKEEHIKLMQEKLFGTDFSNKVDYVTKNIKSDYEKNIKEHQNFIGENALNDVDLELNSEVLNNIKNDIEYRGEIKLGIVSSAITTKVVSLILAKTGAKVAAKTAVKTGAKVVSKEAVATGGGIAGAEAGVVCGPFAFICVPAGAVIGAATAFIATDMAINKADESFNREELKKDILASIEEIKQEMKNDQVSIINKKFEELSKQTIDKYQNAPIKEKRLIKENL